MLISKIIVVFLALLVSSVISAPVLKERSPDELELLPRSRRMSGKAGVMAARMKYRIKPKPNKSLFWSGRVHTKKGVIESERYAGKFARMKRKEHIHHALRRANIKIPEDSKHEQKLWRHASKVFAKNASGHVHAVLGSKLAKKSVYKTIEKPTLMNNPKVHKMTEHNAETGESTVVKNVPRQ